jgi:serine phosphatase RsbU (regulator of sigma subunit)
MSKFIIITFLTFSFSITLSFLLSGQNSINANQDRDYTSTIPDGQTFLTAESIKKYIWLRESWRYHPGDNPQWADPEYDDSDWEITNTVLRPKSVPTSGWNGIGWYRLHITVDSLLLNKPLIIDKWQGGPSEVYLNGELLFSAGTVGATPGSEIPPHEREPKTFSFGPDTDNVIAVRYSNHSWRHIFDMGGNAGFLFTIADVDWYVVHRTDSVRRITILQIFFTAIPLSLALLHILLFFYYPPYKENLFYSISMLGFAGITFFAFYDEHIITANQQILYGRLVYVFRGITLAFVTITLYYLFRNYIPRFIYIITGLIIAIGIWGYLQPFGWREDLTNIFMGLVIGLLLYEMFRQKSEQANDLWIVKTGFVILFITVGYQYLILYNIISPIASVVQTYIYGALALSVSMTVYLSRKFGRINRDLEVQLEQVKILSQRTIEQERQAKEKEIEQRLLEADNQRKTKELEDARKLQISMLPKDVPEHRMLDIAVYMKTATEVGGDYYDFHLHDDGALTVAIGDATGHGMKAGMMVALAKSLFHQLAEEKDITRIFHKFTESVKTLKLEQLYMGLTLARFHNGSMTVSAAGMPPVYIYRHSRRKVEEIKMKGMPLGSFSDFPYVQKNIQLSAGDTILFMSDGLPELFNKYKETFDYSRVVEIFSEASGEDPGYIIHKLVDAGENWMNGTPQEDDITFVVMKIR